MTASNIVTNTTRPGYQGLPGLFPRMRRRVLILPRTRTAVEAVTVGKLLSSINMSAPKHSLLLGECRDGLPFLVQLGDPTMGAVLIGGDQASGKTHQLQVMVDSAMRLNHPHEIQVSILTHKPDEWRSFWDQKAQEKYLYQIKAWYDPAAEALIEGLITLAEARRSGEGQGAAILLILDDFNFVGDLSYEAQVNLHWLLAYGAQSGIWIVAAVKGYYADKCRYWIDCFRTRIIGSMADQDQADILSNRQDSLSAELSPGFFRMWSGSDWLTYRLPLLGD